MSNDHFSKSKLEKAPSAPGSSAISSSTAEGDISILFSSPVAEIKYLPPGGKYQPQVSHLEQPKLQEMKPVKQNVTYDSSTGKMYEELGSTNSSSSRPSYFQSYQASYPYSSMQPPQYMGSSYSSPGYVGPYDRLEDCSYNSQQSLNCLKADTYKEMQLLFLEATLSCLFKLSGLYSIFI